MSGLASCVYVGHVAHERITPCRHAFGYRVFAMCLDVDEIDALDRRLRLFSRGRWNLLSFHDADHAAGSGVEIGVHVRSLLAGCGLEGCGAKVQLVCYPRMLGYVFNPLSVYFCHDAAGRLGAIVYEVTNTLRERRSYVIQVANAGVDGVVQQSCAKELYVSPFTAAAGRYNFRVVPPGDRIVIGIDFLEQDETVLRTHFRGRRVELSDSAIGLLLLRYPLMTLKVIAGIHLEALRLWLKGVPVKPYHASARYSFTAVEPEQRKVPNA